MNEILKNTHIFVDVLSMARCDAVQQWDEGAFQKAFKWATYFEEVYRRLKTKPSLAEKLDKYLSNFNKSGQICLGNFKLSLEALGVSKSLLRQFLLQNHHLSESQYQLMLKLYGVKVGDACTWDCGNNGDLLTDACHLSQTRAAFHLLSKMRDRLTKDMRLTLDKHLTATPRFPLSSKEEFPSAVTSEEVCVDVTARCLFKHVEHQLQHGDSDNRKKRLFEKLHVLAEQENGMRSIVTTLLLNPDDWELEQQAYQVTQFILDWLIEFLSYTQPHPCLMSIPPHLLSRAAFMYDAFFKLYLSHLLSWGDNMVSSICTEEKDWYNPRGIQWRYVSREVSQESQGKHERQLAFTNLLNHIGHLVTGPDFISKITRKEIRLHLTGRDNSTAAVSFDTLELNIWEDICKLIPL